MQTHTLRAHVGTRNRGITSTCTPGRLGSTHPEGADHDTWGVQYKLTLKVTAVFI